MELIKRDITMIKTKAKANIQLTLDDDFNVPDVKPDIDKLIAERADIRISNSEAFQDKVRVQGELRFTVLYLASGDSKPVHSMSGTIPFDELINLDGVKGEDIIRVSSEVEDLNINIINSRKLSVRSVIGFNFVAEEESVSNVLTEVAGEEDVMSIFENVLISQMQVNKKDIHRIKTEIALPNNKPNIIQILWDTVDLRNMEARIVDERVQIRGELALFILYLGDIEDNAVEAVEFEVPINAMIDCVGCREEMIPKVNVTVQEKSIEVIPDSDGEDRLLDVEVVLELDMKAYDQEEVEIVKDVYSPSMDLQLAKKDVVFENILIKNNTQTKINSKVNIRKGEPLILQICNSTATPLIDNIEIVENGLNVEGVMMLQIMYVAEDDKKPFGVIKESLPFKQFVEARGMNEDIIYDIIPTIAYISTNLLDNSEVEVKAGIELSSLVINKNTVSVISDIDQRPLDLSLLQEFPSVVAYVVKKGDTLWNIAKRYYTTVDAIKRLNNLDSDLIRPGDKLIIVKNVAGAM
ncbi:MAG: hypothetical protein K0R15_1942 [Clostridiales bacterium]|jgi:hypothetical protein|nr:hypothetical protein [Clostridiales bacterium]